MPQEFLISFENTLLLEIFLYSEEKYFTNDNTDTTNFVYNT